MNIIKKREDSDYYFAALKLIEQLYKDGKIPKFMFQNILNEFADFVDLSAFVDYDEKEDAA